MYAQCPECLTFFRIRPEHLKAAGGNVRCSQCKHVFNALESLRDDVSTEEIEAVEAARAEREAAKRKPGRDTRAAGDLFEQLDYQQNEELPLDADTTVPEPPEETVERHRAFEEYDTVEEDAPEAGSTVPDAPFDGLPPGRPRQPRHWAATVALVLVNIFLLAGLAVQLVHWHRYDLLADARFSAPLQDAYRLLEMPLEPPRKLAKIRLSRSEVASHADYPSALRLTAVLENRAPHPQPWPHIRIDLEDRWGEPVGARYFSANEFLRNPESAQQAMPPGERFAVELAIQDPGATAVGFQARPCFLVDDKFACSGKN